MPLQDFLKSVSLRLTELFAGIRRGAAGFHRLPAMRLRDEA
jgi:hypothetical protein